MSLLELLFFFYCNSATFSCATMSMRKHRPGLDIVELKKFSWRFIKFENDKITPYGHFCISSFTQFLQVYSIKPILKLYLKHRHKVPKLFVMFSFTFRYKSLLLPFYKYLRVK